MLFFSNSPHYFFIINVIAYVPNPTYGIDLFYGLLFHQNVAVATGRSKEIKRM